MIGSVSKFIPKFDREIEKTYQPNLIGSLDSLPHSDDQHPLIELPVRIPKNIIQKQSPVQSIYGCLYMFITLTLTWTKLGASSQPRLRANDHISVAETLHYIEHHSATKTQSIKAPQKKRTKNYTSKCPSNPRPKSSSTRPKTTSSAWTTCRNVTVSKIVRNALHVVTAILRAYCHLRMIPPLHQQT